MLAAVTRAKTFLEHLLSPLDPLGREKGDLRKHSIYARHLFIIIQLVTCILSETHHVPTNQAVKMHRPRLSPSVRDKSGIRFWVDLKLLCCVTLHCSFGVQWLDPRALSVLQECSVTEQSLRPSS